MNIEKICKKKGGGYLLDDFALVVTGGEIVKIDDFLDIGLHITNKLELNIGLKKSASDLVQAIV